MIDIQPDTTTYVGIFVATLIPSLALGKFIITIASILLLNIDKFICS
jgi:preprotein translocase subunit Sec61beta